MHEVGLHRLDPPHNHARGGQRQADFVIGGQRDGAEFLRGEELQARAQMDGFAGGVLQGAHDPVDLRMPGVRRDEDAHQAAACAAAVSVGSVTGTREGLVQRMISIRPSSCSATAVQLSTQSPQLT